MSPRTKFLGAASLAASLAIGCGYPSAPDALIDSKFAAPASAVGSAVPEHLFGSRFVSMPAAKNEAVGVGQPVVSVPAGVDRKIIYNGQVELVVEDFTGVPELVVQLVKKYDAYVASSNLHGTSGSNRRACWTIRVPVERYEEFLGAAKGLGEVKSVGTTSSDVSEEYYDVEARIRNKTKEEQRLLVLLEERPGKLEDVIAIERELSRVREELERMQGRMRVLSDLTSLTTVTLTIDEIKNYQPPQTPTLATRARRSFEDSLSAIQHAGESLVIGAVAMAPWLPIVGVVLTPGYLAARVAWRRRTAHKPATTDQ